MIDEYVDYELIGGGPSDGAKGHMYVPKPEMRVLCKSGDMADIYHVYRLVRGTRVKLYYRYHGYEEEGS